MEQCCFNKALLDYLAEVSWKLRELGGITIDDMDSSPPQTVSQCTQLN